MPVSTLVSYLHESWLWLCKDMFFLSTTPFYSGVIGEDNSWRIPYFSHKNSKGSFSNSPP